MVKCIFKTSILRFRWAAGISD